MPLIRGYVWREGRHCAVAANDVGRVVEQIEARDGRVTPQALVDESRPISSATHECFEWDDSLAAEAHRRQQARQVISALRVVVRAEEADEQTEPLIAYASVVRPDLGRAYENTRDVMADTAARAAVLDDALKYLRSFRTRYGQLKEVGPILAEIERLEESVLGATAE